MDTGAEFVLLAALVVAWLLFALLVEAARRASVRTDDLGEGDIGTGFIVLAMRLYARVVHRLRVEGLEHVPRSRRPGPLIVIANHTAGVDPVLVQSVCPFEIRWMMALDMRAPRLDRFWRFARIIFVDRERIDATASRAAFAHLRSGGVLGIFPEGQIERPARQILPFHPGVATFARRTGASILPVVIEGTPGAETAWASLWRTSRSRIRFLPLRSGQSLRIADETRTLRDLFLDATGWPANDNPRSLRDADRSYWRPAHLHDDESRPLY